MTDDVNADKLDTIYEHIWFAHGGGAYEKLDQSLYPRPPEMLYGFVEGLNLVMPPETVILQHPLHTQRTSSNTAIQQAPFSIFAKPLKEY